MRLRPATVNDATSLFAWRNDPETRAMSANTEPVRWAEHIAWLHRVTTDPARSLLIAEADGEAVGTVRIDQGDETELSWTVAPEHRRKGYGAEMVGLAVPGDAVAWIKAENAASRRIAEKNGFALAFDGPLQKWVRDERAAAKGGR